MKTKSIIGVSALVLVAAAAIFYFSTGKKENKVAFLTAKAQYGYISKSITATGTVEPVDTVSVGAQVSGVVKYVYVDFNSIVKQGQLLAKVDPTIIQAQTEQSKANLANTKSNLDYQQSNFDRQQKLYNLGAISKADYQVALNQYNSAKAAIANAAAQVQLSERNLYYTGIYSPINGVVLNRNVSAGQTIASSFNAPTLFVIAKDLTKMQVRAAVDEADIGGVRSGQNVSFTVDAFPEDTFEGIVQQILLHPEVSANVVTYTTLINVDNKALKLKPGMTATINIYLEEDTNALLIPSRALTFKPDSGVLKNYRIIKVPGNSGELVNRRKEKNTNHPDTSGHFKLLHSEDIRKSYVWIKKGDTLRERRILTGLNDDSYVRVIKGLLAGEEVITGVVIGESDNSGDNTQRSPFMPQMRTRTTRQNSSR